MNLPAVTDVAKKKRVSKSDERKPMAVQVRGSQDWKEWLEAMAEKEGETVANFVARAVRKWAKDFGHPDPPKR